MGYVGAVGVFGGCVRCVAIIMKDIIKSIADLFGMPVAGRECGRNSLAYPKVIYLGNNIVWHWEFFPVASCEVITSGKF